MNDSSKAAFVRVEEVSCPEKELNLDVDGYNRHKYLIFVR